MQELTQLSNGMRKQFLEAKNWEMDGYLGTWPPPKGLVHTSKDHLAHLVASVPQKGVTLEVTPLTQMVPTSKHMLTVRCCRASWVGWGETMSWSCTVFCHAWYITQKWWLILMLIAIRLLCTCLAVR